LESLTARQEGASPLPVLQRHFLNQINNMNESTLTTQFLKWCKAYKRETFVFEAKYSKKGIIQFSEVKEHQEHALMVTYHDHLVYKLPDGGYSESPFDGISLKKIPAYIVLYDRYR